MFLHTAHPRKVRAAINGFGRIGRAAFKIALEKHSDSLEIVAINDLASPQILAHLLKYDSAYGLWNHQVFGDTSISMSGSSGNISVDGKKYQLFANNKPSLLPWKDLKVDVVMECTGRFTDQQGAEQHLLAGAKKVVLSAPAKGAGIPTYLMGVNHDKYQGESLLNNASCTTNCIAPVIAIMEEKFGVAKALMTTVHGVTAEQNLVDGPPPGEKKNDLRRARAAYVNIIPTTTGAAISVTEAIPKLKGLFDGRALRVPIIVGSISDITMVLKERSTIEEINQVLEKQSQSKHWSGIIACSSEPLVSTDIIGRPESSIIDLPLTQVVDGDLVKIFAWYDNEFGYANRLVEMAVYIGNWSGR